MKKQISLLLSLVLLLTLTTASAASQANSEQALIKDETVYANLNADGSIQKIYVVNRIETPEQGVYKDYGNYSAVLNLSGRQQPIIAGDEISWQKANEVLYYQGQLDQGELPFDFALEYRLNSTIVNPQEAVGKSGTFAITIKIEPNPKAKSYFRENYVAQIQIPLHLETVSNILAPGATSVIAGKTATLAYTALPGQKASYILQFDTKEFELDSISISCIPFDASSFLSFDASDIKSGFNQLAGGLDQLAGGSIKLQQGLVDLNAALGQLSAGASELAAGTTELAENIPSLLAGTQGLQQGAIDLDNGIGQLAQGAAGLAAGTADMAAGVGGYTNAAKQIYQNAQLINTGLAQLSTEGDGLNAGYQQLVNGLNTAITGLPAQLADLNLTADQQQALGQILAGMTEQLNSQMATFGDGLQEYTAGVSQAAQGMNELTLGLDAFAGQGENLKAGADQLAAGSAGFSQGMAEIKVGSNSLAAGLTIFAEQSQGLGAGGQELSSGANSLAKGLRQMTDGASRLPGDVQSLADGQIKLRNGFLASVGFLADFDLPEGEQQPVSFVSEKVTPRSVQFIASTPALKVKTEEAKAPNGTKETTSFFTRLLKLFKIKK